MACHVFACRLGVAPCPQICRAFSAGLGRLQGQQAKRRSAAVASAMDGGGYNSDEEVYAVARAIDAEDEVRRSDSDLKVWVSLPYDANMELRWHDPSESEHNANSVFVCAATGVRGCSRLLRLCQLPWVKYLGSEWCIEFIPAILTCVSVQADDDDPGVAAAAAADRKRIDPLPPVDHDSIGYDDFAKDFYEEAPDVAALTPEQARRPASSPQQWPKAP